MTTNKYEHSKIYKIVDVDYNKCYIGSTCESLTKRMGRHRREYKACQKDDSIKYFPRSMLLFDEYGIENCKIELIEDYPTSSREELLKREGFHIQNNENCLNRCLAGRTKKEYYDDNRDKQLEHKKQYRLDNIEQFKEKDRKYREENKDKIKERKKTYYENNKEKHSSKCKEYREKNKDILQQKDRERYAQNKDEINRRRREHYKEQKEGLNLEQGEVRGD